MKIYSNPEMTQEVSSLDLGIVQAGVTKEFTYYLLNDSVAYLEDIQITCASSEVNVVSSPPTLKNNESGTLIVSWAPSITLKQGLQASLRIEFNELWS